jgi:hypothetical protein
VLQSVDTKGDANCFFKFLRTLPLIRPFYQGGVFTFLYLDVLSPNSKTRQFDKAVDRVKDDARCTALLGDRKKIRAFGEDTWNKWARNRPIAYVQ